jgi:hypothetical protein
MAHLSIELDLPKSETRAIELDWAGRAVRTAMQDFGAAGGQKLAGEITLPGDAAGSPRKLLGHWSYLPTAER